MKIHHVSITVNNLEESTKFYREMLGFEVEMSFERKDLGAKATFIKLKEFQMELWQFEEMKKNVDPLDDIKIIWDALITCESRCRTKLMAIIAANITIQHSNHIEIVARQCPSDIIGRIIDIHAKDAEVIIKNSRLAMVEYKIPGV